jgi:predicted cupin superfamily sugar epimerase
MEFKVVLLAIGFDFLDFELDKMDILIRQYPNLKDIIEEFT